MATRRRIATFLIVIATLTGIAALVTLWGAVQVFDTDEWTETSERVLEAEEVRTAVGDFLVDELERVGALNGLGAAAIDDEVARERVAEILGSEQAMVVWSTANRAAHSTLIALVDERSSTESIGEGGVRLDLTTLQAQVAGELGVADLGLAPGSVSFQVIPTDRIDEIQAIVDTARAVPIVLLALTVGLYLVALLLAGGSRRRIGLRIGLSLLVIGATGFLIRLAGPLALDALVSPPAEADDAVDALWRAITSLLLWLSGLCAVVGAFLAISTWGWGRVGGARGLRELTTGRSREPAG